MAVLAYANSLLARGFIRDDDYVIAGNFLLRHWSSLPRLLATGYWEGAVGSGAPVQEFRPALMLTYFLNYQAAGLAPWSYHLTNVALHGLNCVLLYRVLNSRYGESVAEVSSALFAVLPIHVEAVAYLTGRSELLSCAFLLSAWDALGRSAPRWRSGLAFFCAALLSKEQSILFPAFLAMQDWVFLGERFWDRSRRKLYAAMGACMALYWLMRMAALPRAFYGGFDYFTGSGYLVRLLTMARFAAAHYAAPLATGLGLRADYTRPFFPDSSISDPGAWFALLLWAAAITSAAAAFFRKRSHAAFWFLCAFLFLLPTSNLILKLDTIGAERFLYLPSCAFCFALACGVERLPRKARLPVLAGLVLYYLPLTISRNRVWATEKSYYAASARENPLSVGAKCGLGVALLKEGRRSEAEVLFKEAITINPRFPLSYYNLGLMAWERGDMAAAEEQFLNSVRVNPVEPDAMLFLALVAEKKGDARLAEERYSLALRLRPWDARAHFNVARLQYSSGRMGQAAGHMREFLRLAPSDPDAPAVRRLLQTQDATP